MKYATSSTRNAFIRTSHVLLICLILAVIASAAWLLRDRIFPTPEIAVYRVISVEQNIISTSENTQNKSKNKEAQNNEAHNPDAWKSADALFQVSGWVEASPYDWAVTSLEGGVVEEVFVVYGQEVKKGQLLARLDQADVRLDLEEAKNNVDLAQLDARMSEAEHIKAQAELTRWMARKKVLSLRLQDAQDNRKTIERAGLAVNERDLRSARLSEQEAEAQLEALHLEEAILLAEVKRHESHHRHSLAKVDLAQTKLNKTQLRFERTDIYSPFDGYIQDLYAFPGRKIMLNMDDPKSATVATVYHPDKLAVHVDVPLADVGQLAIGQEARIMSSFSGQKVFHGKIVRIHGEADITRNTLGVNVQILDGGHNFRPAMLCRVEFLGDLSAVSSHQGASYDSSAQNGSLALLLPKNIAKINGQDHMLWIVDANNKLAQRHVELAAYDNKYYLVKSGIEAGSWVLSADNDLNNLYIGQSISPTVLAVQGGK